ncbi:hypothetical protein [Streptomyces sp. TLI_171]|uniref:hypothetical protein n=1 Tax=Streptomyces sp. TLI_171 TaxID=1938859 RepID=UPI000C19FB3D|nr:hypothetical protein [Streptomyces sp. TLI_171]RKE17312.1 hypothetical protein BX266_0568 [Streptomyces sp. TLI_171]
MLWLSLIVSFAWSLAGLTPPQLPDGTAPSAKLPFGKDRAVFRETFDRASVGVGGTWGWKSGAYAGDCTDNPRDFKLDHLTPDALTVADGALLISARPAPDGRWTTGLITTGDTCGSGGSGEQVRTGDFLLAHLRLPEANTGAWPALWTWRDGHNEIDVFEWHADRPGTAEFVNHTRSGDGTYSSDAIRAGGWLYVGARFGADNVVWYVGATPTRLEVAYQDHTGVGADFAAYPVLSLSVNNGRYHRAPPAQQPFDLAVDSLTIYRPTAPSGGR